MMSAGTKRIIWLLANVFIAGCTDVQCIGIEELEGSIHPKLMKRMLEVLSEALENTCIIISSHSPYLIQYLKTPFIYIGRPDREGVAGFSRIRSSKEKQVVSNARGYGLSVGEYLFELMSGDQKVFLSQVDCVFLRKASGVV